MTPVSNGRKVGRPRSAVAVTKLIEVYIPLLKEDPDFHPSTQAPTDYNMKTIMGWLQRGQIDLNPPYQRRDDAWPKNYKQAFIASVLNQVPIPPFHLVRKEIGVDRHWTLDGKQRLTAIDDFVHDRFPIMVAYKKQDGTIVERRTRWSQISETLTLEDLRLTFLSTSFRTIIWEPMDMVSQKKVFVQINHSSSLNTHERIYCPNFLTQHLMSGLFNYAMAPIRDKFSMNVRTGRRFAEVRAMHELAVMTMGPYLDMPPEARQCRSDTIHDSASKIHDLMLDKKVYETTDINAAVFVKLGIGDQVESIRKWAEALSDVFESAPEIPRNQEARNIVDPLAFLVKMEHDREFSITRLRRDKAAFAKALREFYEAKRLMDLNRSTTDADKMQAKFDAFVYLLNGGEYGRNAQKLISSTIGQKIMSRSQGDARKAKAMASANN